MNDVKYAVYIVIVEDTSRAFDQIADDAVETDTAGQELTFEDAEEMMTKLAALGRMGDY